MNIVHQEGSKWEVVRKLSRKFNRSPYCEAITISGNTVRFWSHALVIDMPSVYLVPLLAKLRFGELSFPELVIKAWCSPFGDFNDNKLADSPLHVHNIKDMTSNTNFLALPNIACSFDGDVDEGYFMSFTVEMLEGLWRLYANLQNAP